jgi:hypothetical protein
MSVWNAAVAAAVRRRSEGTAPGTTGDFLRADLADDRHLDLARVVHFGFDSAGEVGSEKVDARIVDEIRVRDDANLASRLECIGLLDALHTVGEPLELFDAPYVLGGALPSRPGPRAGQGVGGRDQDRDRRRHLDVFVVGGYGVDDFPVLAAPGRHFGADLGCVPSRS